MGLRILPIAVWLLGATATTGAAQDEVDLIRTVVAGALRDQPDGLPSHVCVAVKGPSDAHARDATAQELPSVAPLGSNLTGASACSRNRTGATHITTGESALILAIGVVEVEGERAVYTQGWYRDGLNAGAYRCTAEWTEGVWKRGECEVLWMA